MKIQLSKLTLTNFKGIKSLTIDFGDFTSISGANATGKSTIADAWFFLLFGKNTSDQKDFEIKTLDSKGIAIPRIDHEVTGELLIDGVLVTLRRNYREKWVKKQGNPKSSFEGHETLYFVNDVPKSQSEYQSYIGQIMPEATFKLLTSPTYFNSIKWQDRRAMLTAIATIPDDTAIAGKDLAGLLKIMRDENKTLTDLRKEYAAKKTKIKAELAQIPGRLDEVTRATPEAQDFKAIENEIVGIRMNITSCDNQITDKSKGVQDQVKVRSNVIRLKGELEDAIQNLTFIARKQFSAQAGKKDGQIAELKNQITYKQSLVKSHTDTIETANTSINSLEGGNTKLRTEYAELKATEFDGSKVNDTCPTCKQHLPEGDIEEQRATMLDNFNTNKASKVAEINKKGTANKQRILEYNDIIAGCVKKIATLDAEIIALKQQITDLENTPSTLQSVEAILAGMPDYVKYQKQLAEVVIPEVKEADTTDLQMVKSDYQAELETLQRKLNDKAIIEAQNVRKAELMEQEETLSQELATMEGFEFQISEFVSRKMKAVEDSVNKLFPTVQFRMFDVQVDGGIAETCKTLVNGVQFESANNAGRINAGLEIISVFSKVHDIYAPIVVDNSESVNSLYPVESQLIALYVTEDKKLVIQSKSLSNVA